jgi:hypothetical protein
MIKLHSAFLFLTMALSVVPAFADDTIQMIPPTPIGSSVSCPAGFQQMLSYSGSPASTGQAGINCVPITTDAAGDLKASGYIQPGASVTACTADTLGAVRYNPARPGEEWCNGTSWNNLGGGLTIVAGGCQTYWASCPAGYVATSYFSPGTYNCCDKCGSPAWLYTVCSQQ